MWHESLSTSNRTIWIVTKLLTIIGLPLKVLTSSLRYLYAWNMGWIIIMKKNYIIATSCVQELVSLPFITLLCNQNKNTLKIRPVAWSPVTFLLYKQTCKIILKFSLSLFCWIHLKSINLFPSMGNSRKYPYTTMDGFNILTPPCLRKFQNVLPPHALRIPKSLIPPSPRNFHFSVKPFGIRNVFTKRPTWVILRQTVSHHSTFVWKKLEKKNDFCLPLCNSYNLQKFYIAPNCYKTLK